MFDELDIDGRFQTGPRESSAQNVRYVLHGDIHNEAYRIATFHGFPEENARSVQPRLLAASGFFYTGYKDRVKCFSCSSSVENWAPEDNPCDKKWHSNDCLFANGHDASNIIQHRFIAADFIRNVVGDTTYSQATTEIKQNHIPWSGDIPLTGPSIYMTNQNVDKRVAPIADTRNAAHKVFLTSLQLYKETDRLRSFFNWTSHRNLVETFAADGFFFLGELDRVQCFSCGTVMRNWNQYDNVHADHAQTSPQCRMVLQVDPANVSSSGVTFTSPVTTLLPVLTAPERDALTELFPCNHPTMPHMRELNDRIRSFDHWRRNDIATVDQIVAAGFYYLGPEDKAKCFYCGGGLQKFESSESWRWHEHAKWYPKMPTVFSGKHSEPSEATNKAEPFVDHGRVEQPPSPPTSFANRHRHPTTSQANTQTRTHSLQPTDSPSHRHLHLDNPQNQDCSSRRNQSIQNSLEERQRQRRRNEDIFHIISRDRSCLNAACKRMEECSKVNGLDEADRHDLFKDCTEKSRVTFGRLIESITNKHGIFFTPESFINNLRKLNSAQKLIDNIQEIITKYDAEH